MKLCITEKPSVAGDIAKLLGATTRRDGFYEGNGYRVSWTLGHLCCLYEPDDYTPRWKRWALSELPMLPERYDIKVINDPGIKHQFAVLENLISEADEIVNCGDAGQEGELIQRWVYRKAGAHCPVMRLWTSSLTDEALRDGFAHLVPEKNYDTLFYAGLSRAIGDWILGMNATRLYTLKYGARGQVLSIGRVQTPTLALIVNRQKEIDEFEPRDSWELHTTYRNTDFTCTGDRFDKEEPGLAAVAEIAPLPLTITDVTTKRGTESAPRLFDLTSLQVECNKRFGWSAERTLQLIQSLYEKKLTTYPRVDTTYLSDDIHPKIAPTLRAMTPYAALIEPVLAKPIPKSKKIFDNAKVTDHHAIIPTGQNPAAVALDHDEKSLYNLVARRFIGAFYPECVFRATTVLAQAGEYEFKATGKEILEPGWRVLKEKNQSEQSKDDSEDDSGTLPHFEKGESGPHLPALVKKTSQPPKPYTEGTLLRAMETAGRNIDSDELREALKANGIGRPSTRANIIETLRKRGYIRNSGKSIVATQAGIELIGLIREELLKSAKLTGIWENKLRRIEAGDYSPVAFVREISEMVRQITLSVLSDNSNRRIEAVHEEPSKGRKKSSAGAAADGAESAPKKARAPRIHKLEQVKCPVCGEGHMLKGRAAYGCSRYAEGCGFRLSFDECPADATPSQVNKVIKKKK
ncbi:MAG: DNA topoisomerase 3 [Muribaculaceae bacterium]|nr:DNA topoisomerase 3 [Muribaculaceae bacterium]